jgi:hypothetical protein
MNEVIIWRYTSLCRDFSYFEGFKYLLSSFQNFIQMMKVQKKITNKLLIMN